jgi:hypothetical protein
MIHKVLNPPNRSTVIENQEEDDDQKTLNDTFRDNTRQSIITSEAPETTFEHLLKAAEAHASKKTMQRRIATNEGLAGNYGHISTGSARFRMPEY